MKDNMEEQNYTISLSERELNVILNGLGEVPWKVSDPIMKKIVSQFNATVEANKANSQPVPKEEAQVAQA